MEPNGLSRSVSNSHFLSTSPGTSFKSLSPSATFAPGSLTSRQRDSAIAAKQLKPFQTQDIKVLLLENVNKTGQDILREQGYQVEAVKTSLPEDQLIEKIRYGCTIPAPPGIKSYLQHHKY